MEAGEFMVKFISRVTQTVKNLPAMQETQKRCGFNPWVAKIPGGGHSNPLQYSCLENPHGQRSLAGCSTWACKELDMTKQLSMHAPSDIFKSCENSH